MSRKEYARYSIIQDGQKVTFSWHWNGSVEIFSDGKLLETGGFYDLDEWVQVQLIADRRSRIELSESTFD